jgi:hypothetical protein
MSLNNQIQWINEFQGKTLKAVRSRRSEGDPVPWVYLRFTDGTEYEIHIQSGLYFEAAMYNALRKAEPVDRVLFLDRGPRFVIEVKAAKFPLFVLRSYDKDRRTGQERHDYLPFTLRKVS